MDILILRKEQKRLLVTPSNFEIYEKNIARYDVLNNCARLESEPSDQSLRALWRVLLKQELIL